jgi:VWFA-related protein
VFSSFQSASDAMFIGLGLGHSSLPRFWPHLTLAFALSLALQTWPARAGQAQDQKSRQSGSQQPELTFRLRAQKNLVLVRVVVRDSRGKVVTGLTKDDFRVYDNRRPQVISQFSVESAAPTLETSTAAAPAVRPNAPQPTAPAPALPQRYLGLYFDDLTMPFEYIVYARDAAEKYLAANLTDAERVAIFTSSGSQELDFTADRAKLHDALSRLSPKSSAVGGCPPISDFLADQIVNRNDDYAYRLVTAAAVGRCSLPLKAVTKEFVFGLALQAVERHEFQAANSLQGLDQAVRRMATLPGQRTLVLVSGGFMALGRQYMVDQAINDALRSQVVISALDPKGLVVPGMEYDAKTDLRAPSEDALYIHLRDTAESAVLGEVADGTGGEFFHNSNDLLAGFQELAAPPEGSYVLAFTPDDLKANGAFHKLRVELVNPRGYAVRARRGYYAPGGMRGAETPFTDEVETAAYSQNESMQIPIKVHSQFFKTRDAKAHLTILIQVDVSALQFRKENGRNVDSLTLVTIVFDQDGKFVDGTHQDLDLNLKDATLAQWQKTGMTVKTEFNVKPGTYMVREVVRDEQSKGISALNYPVEIPY